MIRTRDSWLSALALNYYPFWFVNGKENEVNMDKMYQVIYVAMTISKFYGAMKVIEKKKYVNNNTEF